MKICSWAFVAILSLSGIGAPLTAQSTLTSAAAPTYPLAAKSAGIEGTVVLKCVISKEGKVTNPHVVSGPQELRQAALNAVLHWSYKPFYHDGQNVEVATTINVNFNMGHGKEKAVAQAKAQAELAQAAQSAPPADTAQSTEPKP